MPAHKYIDTTLVMSVADPGYASTVAKTGATGTLTTDDGGKTWTVDEIEINDYTYS